MFRQLREVITCSIIFLAVLWLFAALRHEVHSCHLLSIHERSLSVGNWPLKCLAMGEYHETGFCLPLLMQHKVLLVSSLCHLALWDIPCWVWYPRQANLVCVSHHWTWVPSGGIWDRRVLCESKVWCRHNGMNVDKHKASPCHALFPWHPGRWHSICPLGSPWLQRVFCNTGVCLMWVTPSLMWLLIKCRMGHWTLS